MDEISLGMPFASGLDSPKIPLPPPAEALHLQYSMAGYQGQARHKPRKKNEKSASGKKLKQHPCLHVNSVNMSLNLRTVSKCTYKQYINQLR